MYANWQANKAIKVGVNGNLNYVYMDTNDGSGLNNEGFNYSVSINGGFTLPAEIKLTTYGGYYSPGIALQGQNSKYYYYGMSLGRDFLKKRLNVSLYARNPFLEKNYYSDYTETTDYRANSKYSYKPQSFGISVSYRFGELKDEIKKVQKTIENDDVKGGGNRGGGGN